MKDFRELVAMRRSMRKYTEEQLQPEDVATIMRAALMAPSSKGKRSPEYILVEDKHTLHQLSECKAVGSDFLKDAALAVVVCADPEKSDVWIEDASVAAMLVMLQAEDLGIGSCWVQVRQRQDAMGNNTEDIVHELLGVPADHRIVCMIALGHKGMERKPQNEERLQWENVHTDQW